MKHITVLISSLLLATITNSLFAQDISKDTIYLDYSYYRNTCIHKDIINKLKWKKKEGIQFNLCGQAIFLFPDKSIPDTLCYKHLKNYPITKIEDVDSLGKAWYLKNLKPLQKNMEKLLLPMTIMGNLQHTL